MRRTISLVCVAIGLACGGRTVAGQQTPLLTDFIDRSEVLPGDTYSVLRMDIDLNGDGQRELLLAKVDPGGQSGEEGWLVYGPTSTAGQFRRQGDWDFSYLLFRINDQCQLVMYEKNLNVLISYDITASGFQEQSRVDVTDLDAELARFDAWRKATSLKVFSADLKDLEESATPEWTDLITHQIVPNVGGLIGLVVSD